MSETQRGERKSSLRGYEEFLGVLNDEDSLNFSSFIEPFYEIKKGYELIAKKKRPLCYSITYKSVPDILYIAFGTKDRCKGEATKYFRDNFHPAFVNNGWRRLHTEARAIRQPNFDQYYIEKKVPVYELLSLGVTVPCAICGEGNFGINEYNYKQCFAIEGEGDLNVFTKGYIVCKKCHDRYLAATSEK